MDRSISHDVSAAGSIVSELSAADQQRLAGLLDQYLASLENEIPADVDTLLADAPELKEPFQAYLGQLNALHALAAGFGTAPTDHRARFNQAEEMRLGDFVLGREIGRGGMGVVYEAQQISLDRQVALKVLPFAAVLDAKQIARFKNEAQSAAQLQHPNIVPVYAVGSDRGVHYYAMRLIDGQPLDVAISLLKGESPVVCPTTIDCRAETTPQEQPRGKSHSQDLSRSSVLSAFSNLQTSYDVAVAELGKQAASALHAAHEYGVVHRDIKPSNLLLDHLGKLWITDFGLARCQSDVSLTKSGDLVGTMRYMSPEQALGQTAYVDHRTDIYSLGATLYELLILQPPFTGESGPAMLSAIGNDEPARPRSIRANIPADLENVILKAIAKARDDRYATAAELADDLQRFLDGHPTIAKPPTLLDRVGKWARRHRGLVAGVLAASLLLSIGLAISTALVSHARGVAVAKTEQQQAALQQAEKAIEHFGIRLPAELADIAGAEHVQNQFYQAALQYYQELERQFASEPKLRAEMALNRTKIGNIQKAIGSLDEAIESYQRAAEMYRLLMSEQSNLLAHRRHWAVCQGELGLVYVTQGENGLAADRYNDAIAEQERLTAEYPDNWQFAADLARTCNNLGLLYTRWEQAVTADDSQAHTAFVKAIQLQRALIQAAPENTDFASNLAAYCNNFSRALTDTDPTAALGWNRKAAAIYQKLCQTEPDELAHQSALATSYNGLAAIQSREGQLDRSVESYERAIKLLLEVTDKKPAKAYQLDLALSYNFLGLLHSKRGQPAHATEAFKESLGSLHDLVKNYPRDANLHSRLGAVYNNLGIVLEGQHRYEQAATAFQHAIAAQKVAFQAAPQLSRFRQFLSKHYFNYGRVLRKTGQASAAAQAALDRKQLWQHDANRLLSVAEELVEVAAMVENKQTKFADEVHKTYSDAVVATLQEAIAAGADPSQIASRDAFANLRGFPRIEQMLTN